MSPVDAQLLAEKASAIERHLSRVAEKLPQAPGDLLPMSDASDAVILHLWQATQIAIDLALAACVQLNLGSPGSYAEAFEKLQQAGHLPADLAGNLVRAAGFRNLVAHAYERIDLGRVHAAAANGPADLRRLLGHLRKLT